MQITWDLARRGMLVTAVVLSASTAHPLVVSYRQGGGKGSVSDTDDARLNLGSPASNFGAEITCSIDASTHQHCVLQFPNIIGNGANQIPLGSTITSATLTLVIVDAGTTCPTVHQLLEDWVETQASWNNRKTATAWTAAGADVGSHKVPSDGTLPCTTIGAKNVDVTPSVQAWASGALNAGWALVDSGNNDGIDFATSEAVAGSDRPLLTVTYNPPAPSTVNYRSIGAAPPLTNEGTINVTAGSPVVTKTLGLGWLAQNRGRGDVLIVGANKYVILAVVSDDELRLTANAAANYSGNGYFHFPYVDSLAESLVKAEDKGAIAAFSPSGLSLNGPAHLYHQALLEALVGGEHERLGDAVLDAQRVYAETGAFPELLTIYHLLGDPALVLR